MVNTPNRCKKSWIFEHFRKPCFRKQAQVETQFNWIFILVVGAVILIFFTVIVINQKSSSEAKISESVITDLESIFTGGSLSTGTTQLIETPNIEINFDCAGYDVKGVTNPTGGMAVFAPSTVKGRNIITWNLDFNIPFKVTGFLYITSPEMRYIFVDYRQNAARMNSTLPKNMNIEFVDSMDEIKDKNNYKVRLIAESDIFNEDCPSDIAEMGDDLTALARIGDTLKFYSCNKNRKFELIGTTALADVVDAELEPSLYGAIFTDNIDMYNCMIGKAFERAYFVSRVYQERNKQLISYYENINDPCRFHIYDFGTFTKILKEIYPVFDAGQTEDNLKFTDNMKSIREETRNVAYQNEILLQMSCTLTY
jgi:hypothetical protein